MILAIVNLLKISNEQELLKFKAHWQHRLQKVALIEKLKIENWKLIKKELAIYAFPS